MVNKENTLIILDWDDTIFPTSYIQNKTIDFINLDYLVVTFLKKLKKLGKIVIITNANLIWLEICFLYLYQTAKFLKDIDIISAKEKYVDICDVPQWKIMAFNEYVSLHYSVNDKIQNIISIGDSNYERKAMQYLRKDSKNLKNTRYTKNIKLMDTPTFIELKSQIFKLQDIINFVVNKKSDFDIKLVTCSKI